MYVCMYVCKYAAVFVQLCLHTLLTYPIIAMICARSIFDKALVMVMFAATTAPIEAVALAAKGTTST